MSGFGVTLYLAVVVIVGVVAEHNASSHSPGSKTQHEASAPPQQKPGAIASLAKMLIDIPMGVVEAFKDGAEVIESVIVTVMRGLFR